MSNHARPSPRLAIIALAAAGLNGCGGSSSKVEPLSLEELQDPESCKDCHSMHYEQWAGSMHAYAADDPVFLAMNRRGHEETDGALGTFCVNCHAPMAVKNGLVVEGTSEEVESLDRADKGITCYFCHNVNAIEGTHNNPLSVAMDTTMRGPIKDPGQGAPHEAAYSGLVDGQTNESSDTCGVCHDIVLPSPPAPFVDPPVELERTHKEWLETLFSPNVNPDQVQSCQECHMRPGTGFAAEGEGIEVPQRTLHSHDFAAVDVAITDWPRIEEQRREIQAFLNTTVGVEICVDQVQGAKIRVELDNVAAGHSFPSGAAQDRRVWVEVRAFQNGEECFSSGVVEDEQPVVELSHESSPVYDPNLWEIRDFLEGENGEEVHMFWDVAAVTSTTIFGPVTQNIGDPEFFRTHDRRLFPRTGFVQGCFPDRVTVRVRVRPIGLDVLDELIASGHLADAYRNSLPTFTLLPNATLNRLPEVREVTAEWSEATKNDPAFETFGDTRDSNRFDCVRKRR